MANRKRKNEIRIRMTDDEYVLYKTRLEQSEMSGNEFGIHALLGNPVTVIPNMLEITRQIKMLGNNVNQITRAVNFKTQPHAEVIEKIEQGRVELWQLLSRLKAGGGR